jgi:hydrogenase maturation protein HypF
VKRLHLIVHGCVQGVGFRPFVFRLATHYRLRGHICNTTRGVEIDIQGEDASLAAFKSDLVTQKPERASISRVDEEALPLHAAPSFTIAHSEVCSEVAFPLLPDTAICADCLREFSDPGNRRYHYPFIHCTACGPRFSLLNRLPFDRTSTTMTDFPLCEACQKEYNDPSDRRFYSQTTCCPCCGPTLVLCDTHQRKLATMYDALTEAIELLRRGHIIAVKNTGGYLLVADATNENAVQRLREGKRRPKKPFALLVADLASARDLAQIPDAATNVLCSPATPIVLVQRTSTHLAQSVAFDSPYYGLMLPHTAVQHVLINALQRPLVATSGNISGNPLCISEEEAFAQLSDVADCFLVHNRRIVHRLDDSVVQIVGDRAMVIRRARGYTPHACTLPSKIPHPTIAVGSHHKNSFALAHKGRVYVSQHIGDLDSCEAEAAYAHEVHRWESLLRLTPSHAVRDLHPDYSTSIYAHNRGLPLAAVQHHRAHVWSCMLDNNLSPPLCAFSWDGTGYGDDTSIWGGETFVIHTDAMHRYASLYPFRLPGGEAAVREPRRSALGLLYALGDRDLYTFWLDSAFSSEEGRVISEALSRQIHSPLCSSMGRLFDAVSALLGCSLYSSFEGEAALAVEALASHASTDSLAYSIPLIDANGLVLIPESSDSSGCVKALSVRRSQTGQYWNIGPIYDRSKPGALTRRRDRNFRELALVLMDWRPMIRALMHDRMTNVDSCQIALAFHNALAEAIVAVAQMAGMEKVVLTGGVMQNAQLANKAIARLKQAGFTPFWHHQIPPNDGGIALGQIVGSIVQNERSSQECV